MEASTSAPETTSSLAQSSPNKLAVDSVDGKPEYQSTKSDQISFNGSVEEIQSSTLHDVISEWSQGTSIHGVSYALDTEHYLPWRRTIWKMLVALATSIMVWQILLLISSYREYKVNTEVRTEAPAALDFPDVTVCNANLYRYSALNESSAWPKNEKEVVAASQDFDDFILETRWHTLELDEKDVKAVWTPQITSDGRCFRFHINRTVHTPGITGGLNFLAHINLNEYLEETQVAGVFVYITEKGTKINEHLPGIALSTGSTHQVSIERTDIMRETRAPWKTCKSKAPEYTQALCQAECFHKIVHKVCGCRELGDDSEAGRKLDFCPLDFENCYERITDEELMECQCGAPPCRETVYRTQISSIVASRFAIKHNLDIIKQYTNLNYTEEEDYYDNFVDVHINYGAIRREVVTESRAQSFSQLMGSVGGTMGLYIGISVISLVELFGELGAMRLLPRAFGTKSLYGLGDKSKASSNRHERFEARC